MFQWALPGLALETLRKRTEAILIPIDVITSIHGRQHAGPDQWRTRIRRQRSEMRAIALGLSETALPLTDFSQSSNNDCLAVEAPRVFNGARRERSDKSIFMKVFHVLLVVIWR